MWCNGVLHFTYLTWNYLECAFYFLFEALFTKTFLSQWKKIKLSQAMLSKEFQQVANVKTISVHSSKHNECFSRVLKSEILFKYSRLILYLNILYLFSIILYIPNSSVFKVIEKDSFVDCISRWLFSSINKVKAFKYTEHKIDIQEWMSIFI